MGPLFEENGQRHLPSGGLRPSRQVVLALPQQSKSFRGQMLPLWGPYFRCSRSTQGATVGFHAVELNQLSAKRVAPKHQPWLNET